MSDGIIAETVFIVGHGGDRIKAYLARPIDVTPRGSVIVIHHMPGWDDPTKEITRKFAASGYQAICPNLHHREGPDSSPDDAAAASRAAGGVPDERLVGDIAGALNVLRSSPYSNGKVGVIGYCSGGRQSFLAACSLELDAAVDCYGACVAFAPPEGSPMKVKPVIDKAENLSAPLLGLFGVEDKFPTPEEVAVTEDKLKELGKTYEFHSYDGAGHAFFATDRTSYRPEAANDGWQRIWTWFDKYLSA